MEPHRKIRVLHLLNPQGAVRGGVETWLLHIMRSMDPNRFEMDVLWHTSKALEYEEEFRRCGARTPRCPHPEHFWSYGRRFRDILAEYGPYDIVHSHISPTGYPLIWAKQAGVPVRIAHSHSSRPRIQSPATLIAHLLIPLTRRWIYSNATSGLACSAYAAAPVYGNKWQADGRWNILHYGVDLSPLEQDVDRQQMRADLNIPADALVLGHVGRFPKTDQKNHPFLVDIAAEVARRNHSTHLVLIGDGPLRSEIESRVTVLGLRDRTHFLGVRTDVFHLLRGVFDLFLFPSRSEGLPVALIEAQAAGLPCVVSDVISPETAVVPELITWRSLSQSPSVWADAVLQAYEDRQRPTPAESLEIVSQSSLNIHACCPALQNYYIECVESNS